MAKNCDHGSENAARGRRPRAAFSSPRSQFFTIRTSQPANNIYVFTESSLIEKKNDIVIVLTMRQLITRGYINNSLHLARKYARIFVRGHYLFRVANNFPRA